MLVLLNVLVLQVLLFIPSAIFRILVGLETYILNIRKTNAFVMYVSSKNFTRKCYVKRNTLSDKI